LKKSDFFYKAGLTAVEILGNLQEAADEDPAGGFDIVLFPPEDEAVMDEDK
jgi:hypothetical protein